MAEQKDEKMKCMDYTFVIEENVAHIKQLVELSEKAIAQQQDLVNTLEKYPELKEKFATLIAGMKDEIKTNTEKLNVSKDRVVRLDELIRMCKDDATKEIAVVTASLLLEGFGIMQIKKNEPAKPQTAEKKA